MELEDLAVHDVADAEHLRQDELLGWHAVQTIYQHHAKGGGRKKRWKNSGGGGGGGGGGEKH